MKPLNTLKMDSIKKLAMFCRSFDEFTIFVFQHSGFEKPKDVREKLSQQGAKKQEKALNNPTDPENIKLEQEFKRDFADRIKNNQMILQYNLEGVDYIYVFTLDEGHFIIKKINLSEELEKNDNNFILNPSYEKNPEYFYSRMQCGGTYLELDVRGIIPFPELKKALAKHRK